MLKLPALLLLLASTSAAAESPFLGRWNLTLRTSTEEYPSWLEVTGAPAAPAIRIVGRVASAHPAQQISLQANRLTFHSAEHFGKTLNVTWNLEAHPGPHPTLTGTLQRPDGIAIQVSGLPAPALNRKVTAWAPPVPLFNGHDLTGWQPLITEPGKPIESHWAAQSGGLVNTAPGANLRTARVFTDFKLHIEFNCPTDGNSGIYLRGRYEVQVEYEPAGRNDPLHGLGSIYGFLAPAAVLPPRPGQWETFDITLIGRRVTIARNGVTTIDNQEIPGTTGGALDSHEAAPGPLYLQGDHTGGMKYRNILISVPQN